MTLIETSCGSALVSSSWNVGGLSFHVTNKETEAWGHAGFSSESRPECVCVLASVPLFEFPITSLCFSDYIELLEDNFQKIILRYSYFYANVWYSVMCLFSRHLLHPYWVSLECWALETSSERDWRRQLGGLHRGGGHHALTCQRDVVLCGGCRHSPLGVKDVLTPAAGITARMWPSATSPLKSHMPGATSPSWRMWSLAEPALTLPGEPLTAGFLPLPSPLTFSFQMLFPRPTP